MTPENAKLFWQKVKKSEGCWIWTASLSNNGYGQFQSQRAHRIVWQMHHGDIPDGLFVLHRCDVRACVNPNHLFLGTQAENLVDMRNKGRGPDTGREKNGRAKLTQRQVAHILADPRTQRVIAADYGVSQAMVSLIKRGECWT